MTSTIPDITSTKDIAKLRDLGRVLEPGDRHRIADYIEQLERGTKTAEDHIERLEADLADYKDINSVVVPQHAVVEAAREFLFRQQAGHDFSECMALHKLDQALSALDKEGGGG